MWLKQTKNQLLLLSLGLLGLAGLVSAAQPGQPEQARVSNYAECVITAITPQTPAEQVASIRANCRYEYPGASQSGLFGWVSVGHCYDNNVNQAGNRHASLAIFNACSDYFL